MAEQKDATIFAGIRQACRQVAECARHVRVRAERISSYAASLCPTGVEPPRIDAVHHFVAPPGMPDAMEATLAYFVSLDAVNFGSGYFPHLAKRPGMSGYFTIASSLADRFRDRGPVSAEELAQLSPTGCAHLFNQDPAHPAIAELMSLFARAWNDLGCDLLERFGGRFTALIEDAGRSASRLIRLLDAQPFFHDVADYRGAEVPFYKRSQILASDLALAFDGRGPGRFDDLDRLTIFADNLVPHVLRVDGVLAYDGRLLERIERGDRIASGSEEEVEIRACAVHAAELIASEIRNLGHEMTSRELDILLWNRGQRPEIKRAGRRHRTRCVFY